MANIYKAAHFSIIAAGSQGSQHGLPGVRPLSRLTGWIWERIGNCTLMHIPRHSCDHLVQESPWAKRAWTLQECYFSKRRLFFIDEQVLFVCNSKIEFEVPSRDFVGRLSSSTNDTFFGYSGCLSGLNPSLPPEALSDASNHRTPWLNILGLLSEYSSCVLTFDSDALRAIVGALKTFQAYGIRHLWGVPLALCDASIYQDRRSVWQPANALHQTEISLPLAWEHGSLNGCERRYGMPSWSPLGWKDRLLTWNCPETDGHIRTDNNLVVNISMTEEAEVSLENEQSMIDEGRISQILEVWGCWQNSGAPGSPKLVCRLSSKSKVEYSMSCQWI